MSPVVSQEIKNALWGCLEIPLYLKQGTTRFLGTKEALKRSFLIPLLLIPVTLFCLPSEMMYDGKPIAWQANLMFLQTIIGTSLFGAVLYFFKAKHVTVTDILKCVTCYNWLSLPAFIVSIPVILLGVFEINAWVDVSAMLLLITLYNYSFLAFMIANVLRIHILLGLAFAITDLMMSSIVSNLTQYCMLHNF